MTRVLINDGSTGVSPVWVWGTAGGGDLPVSSNSGKCHDVSMTLDFSGGRANWDFAKQTYMIDTGEAKNLKCSNFSDPCFGFRVDHFHFSQ